MATFKIKPLSSQPLVLTINDQDQILELGQYYEFDLQDGDFAVLTPLVDPGPEIDLAEVPGPENFNGADS